MDLQEFQYHAIALAGTVALPPPFPAYGPISLVVTPADGFSEIYVKIVQLVSAKRLITRFVRLADVRAIQSPEPGRAGAGGPETWPIRTVAELQEEIRGREDGLRKQVAGAMNRYEFGVPWREAAIVYVPETAQVLHRNEVGVTAAVSAEEVGFTQEAGCGCHGGHNK